MAGLAAVKVRPLPEKRKKRGVEEK